MTEPRGTEGAGGTQHPDGRACPRCGTARAADRTPACDCAQDVSDALREARTAEAAAAEDFDPLRIRPYVELEGAGPPDVGETMALRAVSAPAAPASTLPTPLAPGASAPSAQDLSLFDPATATLRVVDDGTRGTAAGGRHRRTVLLGAGGAVVAVVAAAGLASGLFAYDAPSRDEAQPKDVRAGVPAPSAGTPETTRAPGASSAAPPASASVSASPSGSPTESPSPSASGASPTPSPSAEPSRSPSTAASSAPADGDLAADPEPPVLSRGSQGPEVVELELRLTQLRLYTRPARGTYDQHLQDAVSRYQWARGISPEEWGVYDLKTRQRLESETSEP
ncbi:peptidoglycan-binding domain-containing protein [Streptomyces sp. NPDC056628]|uniref:peptidoglycan-binding domain-containing protein n=1 Tax=Streptomyces sp. NPDC056628 TaxID=3345882 RepID=UPI00369BAA89